VLGIVESDTKTHDDRKVPIPASVVELLRTELPTESESLVFPGREGGYLPSASSGGHSTKPSQVCNLPPPRSARSRSRRPARLSRPSSRSSLRMS